MKNDTTILSFRQSESIADALTDLAWEGLAGCRGKR